MALDLVDAAAVDALAERLAALEVRTALLRQVAEAIAADPHPARPDVRDQAIAALHSPVPPADPDVEIVEAWGCPKCGRVDAPQPCLDVCIRRPVLMADARDHLELARRVEEAKRRDDLFTGPARFAAHVTPRPGREEVTWATLRSRARAALDAAG